MTDRTQDIMREAEVQEAEQSGSSFLRLLKVLAVIAAASFVLFFIQRQTDSEIRTFTFAPEFEFTTFEGETLRLVDLRGQPVVLNFWASWCGPCRAEAPLLAEAWQQEQDGEIIFIGLTHSDTQHGALSFIEEYGLHYPNGPDPGNAISRLYGVQGIPATFFIDAEGRIVDSHRGMLFSADDLSQRLEELRSR